MLQACGAPPDPNANLGSFALDPETCRATHPAGISLLQSPAAPERLILSAQTDDPGAVVLSTGDRPVLTVAVAPLEGQANSTFPDARVFWSAFGQADTLTAGEVTVTLADQAGLRDAMVACAYDTAATDGGHG